MKIEWKTLWNQYRQWNWEKKILLSAAALSLIPLLALWLWPEPVPQPARSDHAASVDTYIPKGFALVPIEVRNYEALDSVLGKFGLVDLYQGGPPESSHQKLVGRNMRLLRAPQNPSHFAVLVPESEASRLIAAGAEFTVIVKRPGEHGTELVKESVNKRRIISYEGASL